MNSFRIRYRQWFSIDFYLPQGFGCYTLYALAFAGSVTKTTIKIYYPRYNEGMVEATKEKNHHLIFNNPSWKINENKVVEQSKPSACNPASVGQHQSTLNENVGDGNWVSGRRATWTRNSTRNHLLFFLLPTASALPKSSILCGWSAGRNGESSAEVLILSYAIAHIILHPISPINFPRKCSECIKRGEKVFHFVRMYSSTEIDCIIEA